MFDMFGKEAENTTRRLPVYLLLDTSGSMSGDPIQGVNNGVQLLRNELLNNPQALDTVHLGVITFSSQAELLIPLTDLMNFNCPELVPSGATAMGAALSVLNQSLDTDIVANTPLQKGDYRPLIFLLSDGDPTDNWRDPLDTLRNRSTNRIGTFIALACGPSANTEILKQIADVVLLMNNVTSDSLQAYFQWVSASVSTASVAAGKGRDTGHAQAPGLPPAAGVEIV